MDHIYRDDYLVCEQPDGWFKVTLGDRELSERFASARRAQQHVEKLIERSDGRMAGYVRYWTGTCPNCNVRDSLRIARTGGAVVHVCGQPDSPCNYEKNVGPMPAV